MPTPVGSIRAQSRTAADQFCVSQRAMRFPAFRQIASTASVTLPVAGTLTNFDP
jgi:D-alanyl-D-alanine carboxypeptidase